MRTVGGGVRVVRACVCVVCGGPARANLRCNHTSAAVVSSRLRTTQAAKPARESTFTVCKPAHRQGGNT
jgi:hypothetical protein